MNKIATQMYRWGPKGVSVFGAILTVLGAAVVALLIYTNAPDVVGVDVKPGDTIKVQPATGPEGYDVLPFCLDPATKLVAREPVPSTDVTTYTLERIRDGRQELVVWRDVVRGAEHWFYDAAGVQQKENAYVEAEAKECILSKRLEPRP